MIYDKVPITIDQQIAKLMERGLNFESEDLAKKCLNHISYYQLAGYLWPMQSDKENHIFKEGCTFENAISIYNFDTEIKLLQFDIIEKI